jgi:hypothetical protein
VTRAYQFRRALRLMKIARPIWLRPSYSKTGDMLLLARRVLDGAAPTANIIFHSSELLAGASPYNQTEEQVETFYRELETLLAFLQENEAVGSTFHEFYDAWVAA